MSVGNGSSRQLVFWKTSCTFLESSRARTKKICSSKRLCFDDRWWLLLVLRHTIESSVPSCETVCGPLLTDFCRTLLRFELTVSSLSFQLFLSLAIHAAARRTANTSWTVIRSWRWIKRHSSPASNALISTCFWLFYLHDGSCTGTHITWCTTSLFS